MEELELESTRKEEKEEEGEEKEIRGEEKEMAFEEIFWDSELSVLSVLSPTENPESLNIVYQKGGPS